MNSVGRIKEIWRYPVSSAGGERITEADLSAEGIAGDRHYGLIDGVTGQAAAPEKHARWRKALYLQARCVAGKHPQLSFPDGKTYLLNEPSLNGILSDYFGFAAAVAAYPHVEAPGDFPRTQYRHPHFPVHVLTTASLKRLADLRQTEAVDVRRFRPTVLVEATAGDGFIENEWIGQHLRLGTVDLTVRDKTQRCGMTFISQPDVEEDPEILRNILRHNKRTLGVYCSVGSSGTIKVGDEIFMTA